MQLQSVTAALCGHCKGWCAHALTTALHSHGWLLLCYVSEGTIISGTRLRQSSKAAACPSDFVCAIVTDNITMWLAAAGLLMSDGASLLCIHPDYSNSTCVASTASKVRSKHADSLYACLNTGVATPSQTRF